MERKTNKPTPPPLRASASLHGDLVGSISATAQLGPVPKPPGSSFIDRNLKAGKLVLKEGVREAIVESIKWIIGLKSPPAQAP